MACISIASLFFTLSSSRDQSEYTRDIRDKENKCFSFSL